MGRENRLDRWAMQRSGVVGFACTDTIAMHPMDGRPDEMLRATADALADALVVHRTRLETSLEGLERAQETRAQNVAAALDGLERVRADDATAADIAEAEERLRAALADCSEIERRRTAVDVAATEHDIDDLVAQTESALAAAGARSRHAPRARRVIAEARASVAAPIPYPATLVPLEPTDERLLDG
jgi:hypothetical protein